MRGSSPLTRRAQPGDLSPSSHLMLHLRP